MNARKYLSQAHPDVVLNEEQGDVCYILQDWMAETHNIELDNGGEIDPDIEDRLVYNLWDDDGNEFPIEIEGDFEDGVFHISKTEYHERV